MRCGCCYGQAQYFVDASVFEITTMADGRDTRWREMAPFNPHSFLLCSFSFYSSPSISFSLSLSFFLTPPSLSLSLSFVFLPRSLYPFTVICSLSFRLWIIILFFPLCSSQALWYPAEPKPSSLQVWVLPHVSGLYVSCGKPGVQSCPWSHTNKDTIKTVRALG